MPIVLSKICSRCGKEKSVDNFYANIQKKDGVDYQCKDCAKKAAKKYRQSEKGKVSSRRFRHSERGKISKRQSDIRYKLRRYNITLEEYTRKFNEQNGCCAMCGRSQLEFKNALAVDHDHKTRKNRGLLCVNCNRIVGVFENESAKKLVQEYLVKFI